MCTLSQEKLAGHLKPGFVYRREDLTAFSKAVDRDLLSLTARGVLEKVSAGIYYLPKKTRFGALPPDPKTLVKAFLRDKQFLLFSPDAYNALGLGFTQIYNRLIVYNRKRHGVFQLAGQEFEFRRPSYGFSKSLTLEFLLVDLLNHTNELADEELSGLFLKIKKLAPILLKKAEKCAQSYGKVKTKKILKEALNDSIFT